MLIKFFMVKIILMFILIGGGGCYLYSSESDKKVQSLMSEYTFVGMGPAKFDGTGEIDQTYIEPHNESIKPLPQKLSKGTQYIFHHKSFVDNEHLALQELPAKLTSLGFTILKKPKSTDDLIYLFMGGPLFSIRFANMNKEYLIFTQTDNRLSSEWTRHDYVLVRIR